MVTEPVPCDNKGEEAYFTPNPPVDPKQAEKVADAVSKVDPATGDAIRRAGKGDKS